MHAETQEEDEEQEQEDTKDPKFTGSSFGIGKCGGTREKNRQPKLKRR